MNHDETTWLFLVSILLCISYTFANIVQSATCDGNTIISLPITTIGPPPPICPVSITNGVAAQIDIELINIPIGDSTYDQGFTFSASAVDPQSKYIFILIQRLSDILLPQTLIKIHKEDVLRTDIASIEGEIVEELGISFNAMTFECITKEKSRLIGVRRHSSSERSTEIYTINFQQSPAGETQINEPRTVIGPNSMDILTYNPYQQHFMHISSDMNKHKWLNTYSISDDEAMINNIEINILIHDTSNLCGGYITSIEPISSDLYYIACINSYDIPQIYVLDVTVPTMPEIKDLLHWKQAVFPAGYSVTGLITTKHDNGKKELCIGACDDIEGDVDEKSNNENKTVDDNNHFNALLHGANDDDRNYLQHSDEHWYSTLDIKITKLDPIIFGGLCGMIGLICIACTVSCIVCFKRKPTKEEAIQNPPKDPTEDPTDVATEDPKQDSSDDLKTFSQFSLLPICTVIPSGIIFGLCLNKGRVFEPNVIIHQMLFKDFIMLKMFLSASGTSAIAVVVASYLYPKQFAVARSKYNSVYNIQAVILGAFILGVGMSVAGSCPGMVLVQFGAGIPNSYITFGGLLFGAFLYGITEPLTSKCFSKQNIKHLFVDRYFTSINYPIIGILFGLSCWIIVIIFEILWSWQSELVISNKLNCNFLTCSSWPPQICGLCIGLLQISLISVLGNTIGCASSYVCIMSQWLRIFKNDSKIQNIFKHFKAQINRWWQVFFVLSAVLGSWIAVLLTEPSSINVIKYPYDNISGQNELRSFLGGMLMIIGARLAKGCSSGHGLSGFGLLSTSSMFAIPSMFAGGIMTAFIVEYINII